MCHHPLVFPLFLKGPLPTGEFHCGCETPLSLASVAPILAAERCSVVRKGIALGSAKVSLHAVSPVHTLRGTRELAREGERDTSCKGHCFSSHVTHSFYQETAEEVLLPQGCVGGLEVFPVTALSLPLVNLIGEDKPFLDHCPWFTVLLPDDQNRFCSNASNSTFCEKPCWGLPSSSDGAAN